MENKKRYINVFTTVFNSDEKEVQSYSMDGTEAWDSITHLSLITEIEDEFDLMFDSEDILDLRSFNKGVEILKKYDISIE